MEDVMRPPPFTTTSAAANDPLIELVFVPAPGVGHIVSTVEIAKLLITRDDRLSITILVLKIPNSSAITDSYLQTTSSSVPDRIRFIHLPPDDSLTKLASSSTNRSVYSALVENQKRNVKEAVTGLMAVGARRRLAGFVLDMFCTGMIDVADELGLPTYVYFTSNAAFLGLMLHVQSLSDNHHVEVADMVAENDAAELAFFISKKPIPVKLLPSHFLERGNGGAHFLNQHARRFRRTKGILINTFWELESYALHSLSLSSLSSDDIIPSESGNGSIIPPIYPVGPLLDLKNKMKSDDVGSDEIDIMGWLDKQPESSVVFLCFGSMGSFGEDQLKEIARGLELSGHRFLWSIRRSPPKGKMEFPKEYKNLEEVLPEGFSNRTAGIGKIIGWAPQASVLGHRAVGGFVSHCGWNSTLESLWFGVPMATWPLYAEQQFNAFRLVKELEIAVEITIAYRRDTRFNVESEVVVSGEEVERGVRLVMEKESEVRKKVKELKDECRKAMKDGGSSHTWLGRFIDAVMQNMPEKLV